MLYVTQLEGALNVAWQEYQMMLSTSEVQEHLRDCIFQGLHKQLHDSMCYLYDETRITYPQLVTALSKTYSGRDWIRGKDNIMRLSKQIMQLQMVVQKPQKTSTSSPQQLESERDGNGNQCNTRGQGKNQNNGDVCECKGIKCFQCKGWGH